MSRGRGIRRTGVELGFILFQILAVIFLLSIVFQHISAKTTFEDGIDFLPVVITYDSVESYVVKDSDGDRETKYKCHYIYMVDGKQYERNETRSTSVSVGDQREVYYNPNNPTEIAGYRNAEEMLGDLGKVKILFTCFQIIAIVFLVLLIRKKITRISQNREYEEQLRCNMERNIAKYESIDIAVDRLVAQDILESLRQKAFKSQKRVETHRRWEGLALSGNSLAIIGYAIFRVIAKSYIEKAKDKMIADRVMLDKEYKRLIAEPILNKVFDDYTYRPSQGFSGAQLTSFKLYKDSLKFAKTEDMIEGNYKGIHYCQSDVCRERRSDESKEFAHRGRICVYDFIKKLDGEILIANVGNSNIVSFGMEKVHMESIAFNKRFQVYASNPHIAYYVLTPQFIEYLLELNIFGEFAMRFSENNIFVLRNNINGIFEADIKHPFDIDYEIGKCYVEIKEIIDFIDIMNLERIADEVNTRAVAMDNQSEVVETSSTESNLSVIPDLDTATKSSLKLKIPT